VGITVSTNIIHLGVMVLQSLWKDPSIARQTH